MVHDHISEDPKPDSDDNAIMWMFLGAGFIAVAIQAIKYLIKIL